MSEHTHKRAEDEEVGSTSEGLNEKTYVQIGLVLVVIGFVVGAIWWAATMQSKMDQVIEEVKTSRVLQTRVNDNETKVKILEMRFDALTCKPTTLNKP